MDQQDIMKSFEDLKVPGKRKPINRTQEESALSMDEPWDSKPLVYFVGGKPQEFFPISALAHAIGKASVTIRSWENKGLLPPSPYRSPKPRKETIPGVSPKGRRLWTREQIEGILDIARQEGVILNGKPPTEKFAHRVAMLFRELLDNSQ